MQSRVWESKEIWGNTAKGLPGKPDWHSLCAVLSQESAFVWILYAGRSESMRGESYETANTYFSPCRSIGSERFCSDRMRRKGGFFPGGFRQRTESSAHTEEQDAKDDLKDMVTDAEDGVRDLVTDAGDMAKDAGDAAGDVVKDAGDAVKNAVDDDSSKATSDER